MTFAKVRPLSMSSPDICPLSLNLAGLSPFTYESNFLQGVDIVSIILLTYTGIVAPYEVRLAV